MCAWFKGEFGFGSVDGMGRVARFVCTHGHVLVKNIRDGHAQSVAYGHGFVGFGFHVSNFLAEVGDLVQNGLRCFVIAGFFGRPYAARSLVFRST